MKVFKNGRWYLCLLFLIGPAQTNGYPPSSQEQIHLDSQPNEQDASTHIDDQNYSGDHIFFTETSNEKHSKTYFDTFAYIFSLTDDLREEGVVRR